MAIHVYYNLNWVVLFVLKEWLGRGVGASTPKVGRNPTAGLSGDRSAKVSSKS